MSARKRVAVIGDGLTTTGFGTTTQQIVKRLLRDGWEVGWIGLLDVYYHSFDDLLRRFGENARNLTYYPACQHDSTHMGDMVKILERYSPNAVFIKCDPGFLYDLLSLFERVGISKKYPVVSYFPIEGLPINLSFAKAAQKSKVPITYCKFGSDEMYETYGVRPQYVYLGLDHARFQPLDKEVRDHLRRLVGWDDKFIVGFVGTNKGVNRIPVLIEACGELLRRGHKDIYFYLHTDKTSTGIALGGWSLEWMISHYGCIDENGDSHILFPPEYKKIAASRFGREYDDDEALEWLMEQEPPTEPRDAMTVRQQRGRLFSFIPFAVRYGLFDLYIDPASMHGFNLPLGEAMRCGVPSITVDDGFARTEIYVDRYAAYGMKPYAYDYWHTGAKVAIVDVEEVVKAVQTMYLNSATREKYARQGKEFADKLRWENTYRVIRDALESAL